ncbi:MAG TPA: SPOR domain-containing protein [Steroidobacteraceae bacterium]
MRIAFFVLLLANLLFMAWANWIDVPPEPRSSGAISNLPKLQLADEERDGSARENRAERGGLQPTANVETATATSSSCVSVGPFNDLARAARAAAMLRERGFQPRQRAEEGETWEGYWVFIRGIENDAEEKRVLTALRNAGIQDAHPMPGALDGRRISLGLFSERARAERRARAASRLGFEPQITERRQSGTVYWVDLDLGAGNSAVPTEGLVSLEEAGARIGIRVCPGLEPEAVPGPGTTTADAGASRPG